MLTLLSIIALGIATASGPPQSIRAAKVVDDYLDGVERQTLQSCVDQKIDLPDDFVGWVNKDPMLRASVYGCGKDPLAVLTALRALELDLGKQTVRQDYPQLAVAFAIQNSYRALTGKAGGWNDADAAVSQGDLPDLAPRAPLVLTIPQDPRVPANLADAAYAQSVPHVIVRFLEDHTPISIEETTRELAPLEYDDKGIAKPRGERVEVTRTVQRPLYAADVIASAELQREFNACMAAHGHPEVQVECGDKVVFWKSTDAVADEALRARIKGAHKLFEDAYRATGRMPAARDPSPTASQSMAWFVRNDRQPLNHAVSGGPAWPMFPLNAPWPILMMLAADDQPLREREEIWVRLRDHGEFRTYGEYTGGIAQQGDMQAARRLSPFPFDYGSIQMMWKDGGVCGTMGNIGARTNRIGGIPASTAGQPGHCAMVFMQCDPKSGEFSCNGAQYATGGDDVTTVHADWNYDGNGGRRPMVFHQSVAWAINRDAAAYVGTLVLRRAFDALAAEDRAASAPAYLRAALAENVYAMPMVVAAIDSATTAEAAIDLLDEFSKAIEKVPDGQAHPLYAATVRDLAHARVLALAEPTSREGTELLLENLVRQGCTNNLLLARCWRTISGEDGFVDACVQAANDYIASPDRSKGKQAANRFTTRVNDWCKTIKGKKAKESWAKAMLTPFAGKEFLSIRGKSVLDPVVAALCKVADQRPPTPAP